MRLGHPVQRPFPLKIGLQLTTSAPQPSSASRSTSILHLSYVYHVSYEGNSLHNHFLKIFHYGGPLVANPAHPVNTPRYACLYICHHRFFRIVCMAQLSGNGTNGCSVHVACPWFQSLRALDLFNVSACGAFDIRSECRVSSLLQLSIDRFLFHPFSILSSSHL